MVEYIKLVISWDRELYELITLFSMAMMVLFIIKHAVNCLISAVQGDNAKFSIGYILPLVILNFIIYLIKF